MEVKNLYIRISMHNLYITDKRPRWKQLELIRWENY